MTSLVEFDVVFISYDEPNAEENWASLLRVAPWAERVHGVKGFDAAHKAAANKATTERFITVDGDNIVIPTIFNFDLDTDRYGINTVVSFSSKNNVNDLVYGNGGLKLWPKEYVLGMQSHENSEGDEQTVDFCWEDAYKQFDLLSSHTFQTGSAFQAFRAGFREGVKMCLNKGDRVATETFTTDINKGNLQRLLTWCTIGRDIEFGSMSILGARLGLYNVLCTDMDISVIADYDWFNEYWSDTDWVAKEEALTIDVAKDIKDGTGITLLEFDAAKSQMIKQLFDNNFKDVHGK